MGSADAIARALEGVRHGQGAWDVTCPVHGGKSLRVTEKDGTLLVNCKAGCAQADVVAALKERNLWPTSEAPVTPIRGDQLVAEYDYGLAVKGRFETLDGKSFRWRLAGEDAWKGLGKLRERDLPLYSKNLGDSTSKPVYVTEGEKAANACGAVGLSAVCSAGGASAKDFGSAFDVLRGRDVILWPDNDDAGRGLMRRIAGALEGVAASVRFIAPDVPPKGDAFDYFGRGGTTAALEALLKALVVVPTIEAIFDGYLVTLPDAGGCVKWEFTRFSQGRGLDADLEVWQEIPGCTNERFSASLNLKSNSNREAFRRQLDSMFGSEINWTAKLNRACQMVREAYRAQDSSILLDDAEEPDVLYLSHPYIAAQGVSILFGAGGSGKTMFALRMALTMALEGKAILYVDYEATAGILKRRMVRLLAGMGELPRVPPIYYWPGEGRSVPDMIDALRYKVHKDAIDLLIIDSALVACGGDPVNPETVRRFFAAIDELRIPCLLISHVTKDDDVNAVKYPFGSVMWHNLARLTWNVRASKEDGFMLGLFQRKANEDEDTGRAAYRLTFSDDAYVLVEADYKQDGKLAGEAPQRERIWNLLGEGDYTASEIASALAISVKSVQNRLSELRGSLVACGTRNGETVHGRKDNVR